MPLTSTLLSSMPLMCAKRYYCDRPGTHVNLAKTQGITHQVVYSRSDQHLLQGAFYQPTEELNEPISQRSTRHLPNYLGWRRMLKRHQQSI